MSHDDKEQLLSIYTNKLKSQEKAKEAIDSPVDRILMDKLIEKYGLYKIAMYIEARKEETIANGTFSILSARIEQNSDSDADSGME